MRYSTAKHVFLCVLRRKISFVQVPTLTSNYTNAIIHRKRRLFECFSVENWFVQLSPLTFNCTNEIFHYNTSFFECFALKTPICASVNYYLKLHKCGISPQNTFLVENQLCASAKSDFKLHKCDNTSQNTSFLLFYSEKPICATVNSNFKSHKSNIPSQNTYFWVFFSGKSDLCKCQLWLEVAQMWYSIAKNVF